MNHHHLSILKTLKNLAEQGQLTGVYEDIPIEVYHHPECPGHSSTTIKRILEQSYNHWFCSKTKNTKSLRFGSAFHTFCNEPHLFNEQYKVIHAEKKNSSEWKMGCLEAGERTPITLKEFRTIEIMSRKVFTHPTVGPQYRRAKKELTFFSKDQETGLWKKCRVDGLLMGEGKVLDLKSTADASQLSFASDCRKYLYRVSMAYYCEIVSEVLGEIYRHAELIACETEDPNEIAPYRVDDRSMERGGEEVRHALRTIKRILDEGESAWRGYPITAQDLLI